MDLINGFGRTSSGFGLNLPTGSGQARGLLHFSGIRASQIRFEPADRVRPKRGATVKNNNFFRITKKEGDFIVWKEIF